MTYQQDLARLHKERKARLWPTKSPSPPTKMILELEVSSLAARKAKLEKEITELKRAKDGFVGDVSLIELRETVCAAYGISVHMFVSASRSQHLTAARRAFSQEARSRGTSLPKIAYHIGGRNHATIFNYLNPGWRNRDRQS